MKVAVVGCLHGELDQIYQEVTELENRNKYKIDLLVICGDFQSVRNENDLKCIAMPPKYRKLGCFHKYYSGEKIAPFLTIFIGGNHEASNYLITLPYGGWVAPNIFYMGYSNVIRYKGLRIGGISGIFNHHHRHCGHFERLPMSEDTKRSAYHTRHLEAFRFMSIKKPLDIFISHEWPTNVVHYGNLNYLLRVKPWFSADIQSGKLGSPMLDALMSHLKPSRWFAAHLHVRYEAHIRFDDGKETKFLALDKPLPRRKYLEIVDIETSNSLTDDDFVNDDNLYYDKEWLSVLRVTDEYLSIEEKPTNLVPELYTPPRLDMEKELISVEERFKGCYKIEKSFSQNEPVTENGDSDPERIRNFTNEQTETFCAKLGIRDPMSMILNENKHVSNPEEISLSDDEEDEETTVTNVTTTDSDFVEENSEIPSKKLKIDTKQEDSLVA
ncbi:lariat debranching enzyme A-like [Panonychus citri]|uniref:lariat debranching enzyme A-like n=1 Tax=Panonychus citri TaxID=50023 RepID=UPI002306EF7A|nr:lariat debranching enzyme A-like [Panonychus citri]XP_053205207.1 lariat debranching enzyme A-like [Panonychus citri]XP_053205208.1 lariat debranching enzyme A-like [Panonychus citri]